MNDDIVTIVLSNMKELKIDIKNINDRLETIKQELHDSKCQRLKCVPECYKIFVNKDELTHLVRNEIEKHADKIDSKTHIKTDIVKNIIQIVFALAPLLTMFFTWIVMSSK